MTTSLKMLRELHGLTQERLARDLNVSFYTVRQWETKKTRPHRTQVMRVAEYFNVRPEDLDLAADKKLERKRQAALASRAEARGIA